MNTKEEKIKVILEKIQNNNEFKLNIVLIILKYKTEDFFKYNKSISKFYQKLSNSKSAVGKISNRKWFEKIDNGFYKYSVTPDTTTLYIAMESKKKLNELDLKMRIKKIKPNPIEMEVGFNDFELLEKYFFNLFDYNSGIEVFGNLKRNDYDKLAVRLAVDE
jgi:hypothetical protein